MVRRNDEQQRRHSVHHVGDLRVNFQRLNHAFLKDTVFMVPSCAWDQDDDVVAKSFKQKTFAWKFDADADPVKDPTEYIAEAFSKILIDLVQIE